MVLCPSHIIGQPPALELLLFLWIIRGQVRTNDGPILSIISTLMQILRAKVQARLRLMWIQCDRRIPVPSQALAIWMCRLDEFRISGLSVDQTDISFLALRIGGIRSSRHRYYIKTVAEEQFAPLLVTNPVRSKAVRRTHPRAIVLHPAVDIIGQLVVDVNMVKLGQREVLHEVPTLAVVVGNIHSTVIPLNDVCRIRRIDPHGMVIWVNAIIRSDGFPILSAVVTSRHIRPQAVHTVWILRIHS